MTDIYNKAKELYDISSNDFITSTYKFGICMATFQRKNGKTPEYLTKSLKSILTQTADNWHIYLVGDKYEDDNEFNKLASIVPKDKITTLNLPVALERENLVGHNLWVQGGANAINNSNKLALDDKCDFILHLDDDDSFHPKKIQILNYILSIYKDPIILYHYSTHATGAILPSEDIKSIDKNLILPTIGNVIHSSFCINKSIIKDFKYSSYIAGKKDYISGDAELIEYINKSLKDSTNYSIFIPLLLSYHDKEGETKTGGKRYKTKKKIMKNNRRTRKYKQKAGNTFNVYIYTFCYNEEILLPLFVKYYRSIFKEPIITIYDNDSTDNSNKIATDLGCIVKSIKSHNNKLDPNTIFNLRDNCWKDIKNGWIIICDMDEILDITEEELKEEEKKGTTIIDTQGYYMVGKSSFDNLQDIKNLRNIKKGFEDKWSSKKVCFKVPDITDIKYTPGAHESNPIGNIKYSDKKYKLKHIAMPGLNYYKNRQKMLTKRFSEIVKHTGYGAHYTNDDNELEKRYKESLDKSTNLQN